MRILIAAMMTTAGTVATAGVSRWASTRADRLRRLDPESAARMDASRSGVEAVRITGFDRPR